MRAAARRSPFSGLSGGNQQKAVLARELTLEPLVWLLVAAQPTRGLDVSAVEAVYARSARPARAASACCWSRASSTSCWPSPIASLVLYRGRIVGELPAPTRSERDAIGALMSGQVAMSAAA